MNFIIGSSREVRVLSAAPYSKTAASEDGPGLISADDALVIATGKSCEKREASSRSMTSGAKFSTAFPKDLLQLRLFVFRSACDRRAAHIVRVLLALFPGLPHPLDDSTSRHAGDITTDDFLDHGRPVKRRASFTAETSRF
jgi:hypothetical protein